MGKGGGGPQQVVQTDLPTYAKPYFLDIMDRAATESKRGYTPYGGSRIASQNYDIFDSRDMVRDLARRGSPDTKAASAYTKKLIGDAEFVGRQNPFQFSASKFDESKVSPYSGFEAGTAAPYSKFEAANFKDLSGAFQRGKTGSLDSTLADVQRGTARGIEDYMDPYQKLVTERLKKSVQEDAQKAKAGRSAQAVSSGAFGGSRQAVMEGIAQDELLDRMAQIEAEQGSKAFQAARSAFETDRAAQMDVDRQRLAERARSQGLTLEEAARVQGAAAQERARVQSARAGELSRIQEAQAAELARTQGISISEASRIQQANAEELARVQGISVEEAARIQAANAAEQSRIQQGQADENFRQREFQRSMMEFGAEQAAQVAKLEEAARAGNIQAAQLLEGIGAAQRADEQARIDLNYQDFLAQRDYGRNQLNFLNNIMRGVPVTPSTSTFTPYNPVQQALGAGISALGLYKGLQ